MKANIYFLFMIGFISCEGSSGPDISVSQTDVAFGEVDLGAESNQKITITNEGDDTLKIGTIGTLLSPFSIQNDNCSNQRFSPSDECNFIVRYSPTAPVTDNDSLDIPSNDPDKNPLTISVSGTGKSIYDALSGDGNVNRTILTYDTMMGSATPSDTVDDGAFGIPAGAANPDHVFEGRLSLNNESNSGGFTMIHDPHNFSFYTEYRHIPDFDFEFVQHGTHLIPVVRGLSYGDNSTPHDERGYDYIVGPGRVWKENSDNGYSRAAFPFALIQKQQNAVHNGSISFLFDDSGISNVRYQVTQETCSYFKFDMYGHLSGSYAKHAVSNAAEVRSNFETERANMIQNIKPFADLETDYPGVDIDNFSPGVTAEDLTAKGLYYNGSLYMDDCKTRNGKYAFPERMIFPSYSTAKTVMAGIATMVLAQDYGTGIYDLNIKDYVPGAPSGEWNNVKFNNAIDMSTGYYDSTTHLEDEDAQKTIDFLYSHTDAEKVEKAYEWPYKTTPGTQFVYHTTDTYLVTKGMNEYLKTQQGSAADIFDYLVENVYSPLDIVPDSLTSLRTWENNGWNNGQALGGYGLYYVHDTMAKIGKFISIDDGKIGTTQILHEGSLASSLQEDPGDRGMPVTIGEDDDYWYNNGVWSYHFKMSEYPSHPCEIRARYMVGFGGVIVLMPENDVVYYYVSDNFEYDWYTALLETAKIDPICH